MPELRRAARSEALFAKLFGNNFSLFAGLAAGFSLVFAWFVFARQPKDNEIAVCVFAAFAALCALGWKRRLYAALLSLAVGGLVAAKPFLRPIVDYEYGYTFDPTSETALYFVIPGMLLVALGVAVVLRIRPTRFKTDLALLKPRPLASLGVGVGLPLFAGRTNSDLFEKYGAHLDALPRPVPLRPASERRPRARLHPVDVLARHVRAAPRDPPRGAEGVHRDGRLRPRAAVRGHLGHVPSQAALRRRERIVAHKAVDYDDAEAWDLDFWVAMTPQERLSALVAIRRDVEKVLAAREVAGKTGGHRGSDT
jgi:hypothetical protein